MSTVAVDPFDAWYGGSVTLVVWPTVEPGVSAYAFAQEAALSLIENPLLRQICVAMPAPFDMSWAVVETLAVPPDPAIVVGSDHVYVASYDGGLLAVSVNLALPSLAVQPASRSVQQPRPTATCPDGQRTVTSAQLVPGVVAP